MTLTSYIILAGLALFIFIGAYYFVVSMAGPKKIEEIENLISRGRYKDAIVLLNRILEKEDRNMKALYLLGLSHQKTGDYSNAVLNYRRCIKVAKFSPDVPEAEVRKKLADCLLSMGNYTESKNEYLILTQLEPDNYQNYYEVGKLFQRGGLQPKAIKFLTQATRLNPGHGDSWAALGQAHFQMNNYHEAKSSLQTATQLTPSDTNAHYYLGLTLRFLQDSDGALKALDKAMKDDALKPRVLMTRGLVLMDQKSYLQAVAEFQKGIKLVEKNSDMFLQLHYMAAAAAELNRDMHTAIEHWELIHSMKADYRDVASKLKQYSEFRTDDSIKDFMIASGAQFEAIVRKIIENMGFSINQLSMQKDVAIQSLVSETDAIKRANRRFYALFYLQRDLAPVTENQIREFHETMKERGAQRGVFMTVGDVVPAAIEFAGNRPIELYDASGIVQHIRGAMS
ncbi:MAG: tetratricopeptide repeat protein [Leptospiraceae bacterium]|nr:tetratricopeptide repeat protein [Leptospiraceae bacterium]